MANRQNCSYDANIKCDDKYELNEFYRQIKAAYESGKLTFFRTGTDKCPCMSSNCPRYLAAQQKRNDGNKKILIGKIVAPQGIRGEVRVQTYTAAADDLRNLMVLDLPIKFVRVAGANVAICRVDGVNDRNAAEALRGTDLFISRDALPAAGDGEYYQADLIGFDVMRDGVRLGHVACFQNFGAGDIIELDNGEMVSFIGTDVDMDSKSIKVK